MKSTEGFTVNKTFLDIPNAAELAGFSDEAGRQKAAHGEKHFISYKKCGKR